MIINKQLNCSVSDKYPKVSVQLICIWPQIINYILCAFSVFFFVDSDISLAFLTMFLDVLDCITLKVKDYQQLK